MTAEAGRKESRLFSRFLLSATVVAGDRYGSTGALLWRGCAYPGNSPSFKNALRRCTPITLRSKPSCIQERNATKRQRHLARGVRLPCGLCSQTARLRGCQRLWPFDPTKGPQNGRGRNNRATGNPSGPGIRATGRQFALHPCFIVSLTLCDPTPWATLKKWEKGCRQHIPAPPTNGFNPSGRISALSRSPGGKSFCAVLPCLPFTRFPFNPFALLPFSYPISCSRAAFAATATPSIDRRLPTCFS
jgi:hypothetical protein